MLVMQWCLFPSLVHPHTRNARTRNKTNLQQIWKSELIRTRNLEGSNQVTRNHTLDPFLMFPWDITWHCLWWCKSLISIGLVPRRNQDNLKMKPRSLVKYFMQVHINYICALKHSKPHKQKFTAGKHKYKANRSFMLLNLLWMKLCSKNGDYYTVHYDR